jgi:small subunit ribosomal protein S18
MMQRRGEGGPVEGDTPTAGAPAPVERAERRSDRGDRPAPGERGERGERPALGDRGDRGERGERPPLGDRGPGGPAGDRGPRFGARGGRDFRSRRKVCAFCVDHVREIDYKEVGKLRRYLSDRAKIEPRRKTGTCAKHQRMLTVALKNARHMALLPYTSEHIRGI